MDVSRGLLLFSELQLMGIGRAGAKGLRLEEAGEAVRCGAWQKQSEKHQARFCPLFNVLLLSVACTSQRDYRGHELLRRLAVALITKGFGSARDYERWRASAARLREASP